MKSTADKTVDAARERLRLWGLTAEQVQEIEQRGKPADHMTITSPITGIVISKDALEGMYVNTGTRIYTIADLLVVWLVLDAYESDLRWLRYGQDVDLEADAYPGETFKGKIAFIGPVLADATRTVKVRVNVQNPEGRLKPGMFGHGVVHVQLAEHGRVANAGLAGKWISPQHPEIVKDAPGTCDVCGAPLVRAETLGYVTGDANPRLIVPASAPLITGKRAVVYVEVPGKEGAYEGRDVVLGPRAGGYYLVEQGLREGELVVVNGNFKIDSSLQILAKPSMMNPQGGETTPGEEHAPTAPPAHEGPSVATPAEFRRWRRISARRVRSQSRPACERRATESARVVRPDPPRHLISQGPNPFRRSALARLRQANLRVHRAGPDLFGGFRFGFRCMGGMVVSR